MRIFAGIFGIMWMMGAASASAGLNPDINLILAGKYAYLSQNPATFHLQGFAPGGDAAGAPRRGFGLDESELGVYANIDPHFYGGMNLALASDNSVSVEEAFFQTLAVAPGFTVKAGRFFAALGYLNERHAHTWDFADNPLAYQVFLGTQFAHEGVQVKWLAPLNTYVELGGELGNGRNFPATDTARNGIGSGAIFAHSGGDVEGSNSWRAGVSWLATWPRERVYSATTLSGATAQNSFTGSSQLMMIDGVWKWAPQGNATQRNVILQGEYFMCREQGELASNSIAGAYVADQSGGYVQALYQYTRYWRVGVRVEQLDSGQVNLGVLASSLDNTRYQPRKISMMVDYAPSEFSRLRLQIARADAADNQIILQYQMSLGAHGAHTF